MTAFLGGNPLSYEGVKATNPAQVIQALRNPLASDTGYDIGTEWVNTSNSTVWFVTRISGGVATWTAAGSGSVGGVVTVTGGSGGALSPAAGNISILGTASQITSAGAGSTITLSIPAAFIAPGSIAATSTVTGATGVIATTGNITASTGNLVSTLGSVTAATTVTATLGAITATNGNLVLGTAGNKILSTSVGSTAAAGANSFGKVTLVGGTVTVATTAVTANSIILLTRQSIGATGANPVGQLTIGTITGGTSFVINAVTTATATTLVATDVSSIGWMIIN